MALLRAALTGGIATGKSYVRSRLAAHGIPTLDADVLARDAVAPGTSGLAAVAERFGADVLLPDGSLDRRALGVVVFGDTQARADLEAIVHPRVREATGTWLDRLAAAGESLAVVDIPLLYETGRDRDFDRVIVTSCPRSQQVARVVERDGLTAAQAEARIDAQLPTDDKVQRADFVIDTGGTFGDTEPPGRSRRREARSSCRPPRVRASRLRLPSRTVGHVASRGRRRSRGVARALRPRRPCCSSASRSSAARRRAGPASARRRPSRRADRRRRPAASPSSRTRRGAASRAGTRPATVAASSIVFMPTSTTVAPGLTNAGVTKPARPIATTRMSAVAATRGRSAVREWQIVTVALACRSISAIGLPTMSLRPITTACRPATGMSERRSISITPAGVHERSVARFWTSRPTLTGLKPSTSLSGSMVSNTVISACGPSAAGSGDCTRMPSCAGLAFRRRTSRQDVLERGGRRQADQVDASGRTRRRCGPCCGRRPRTPDPRRPARCRAPGGASERLLDADARAPPGRRGSPCRPPPRRARGSRRTLRRPLSACAACCGARRRGSRPRRRSPSR